jgi:type II secretory pathway component PulM
MLGQQTISTIRTTQEENAEYLESSRSRQLKLLLGAGGLVVLLGLGTYASVWYSSSKKKAEEAKELAAVSQTAAADKARYDEAFATAQRTLATPEWKVMMQSVRAHDRALKQAQWVYSRVPYKPMHLINYKFPQDM